MTKDMRVLGLSPSTKGVGYAVLEDVLVDWGVKTVRGDKNKRSLKRMKELIGLYHPQMVVLEQATSRSQRIQRLTQQIVKLAKECRVKVKLVSRKEVLQSFFVDGKGMKHEMAQIIAQHFPDELGSRLPPKRKPWVSEHYQMAMKSACSFSPVNFES